MTNVITYLVRLDGERYTAAGLRYNDRFCSLALPLNRRLYRTALILAKNPQFAKKLVRRTYEIARDAFRQNEPREGFAEWLFQILICTSRHHLVSERK
ncbi:MAG: hypothetical protein JW795_15780 [Chitinivibrionales bacterium]|nr:hypothetical protein [Chitinivibrionales bacterium]